MKNKQNSIYSFLVFLVRAAHMLSYLWNTRKLAALPNEQDVPSCDYCRSRMLKPIAAEELEILLYKVMEDRRPLQEPPWYEYLLQYDLEIVTIYYQGDRHYELLQYQQPPNPTTPANAYLYPYDQRRENIRKLGKPALGLSPPNQ